MINTQEREAELPKRILPFGPHQGKSIRQVSHRWLTWLSRQRGEFTYDNIDWVMEARLELARRGTSYDGIPPTYHAIDRFSQKHLDKWTDRSIGIAAFLAKLSDKAWEHGKVCAIEKDINKNREITIQKYYEGMNFLFHCDRDSQPITLKTVR